MKKNYLQLKVILIEKKKRRPFKDASLNVEIRKTLTSFHDHDHDRLEQVFPLQECQ
jgi:hypothetical protein